MKYLNKKTEEKSNINEDFEVKDSDFDDFPEDYNPEEEYEKTQNIVSGLKSSSFHESLFKINFKI